MENFIHKQTHGVANSRYETTDKSKMKKLKQLAVNKKQGIYVSLNLKKPFIIFNGTKYLIEEAIVVHSKEDTRKFFLHESNFTVTNMTEENNDNDDCLENSLSILKDYPLSENEKFSENGLKLYFYENKCFELFPEQTQETVYDFSCVYLHTKKFVFVCTLEYDENNKPVLTCDCTKHKKIKKVYKSLINSTAKLMTSNALKEDKSLITYYHPQKLLGGKLS